MKIELKKIGTTLSSRPAGKDASGAIAPMLTDLKENEAVEIDFTGILSFSPSWGDEFLTPLLKQFGDKLVLLSTDNLSVIQSVKLIEDISGKKFNKKW